MRRPALAAAVLAVAGLGATPAADGAGKTRATKTCRGTFVAATFQDVVVPPRGACRLIRSKVTGGVYVQALSYFEAADTNVARGIDARRAQTVFVRRGSSVRRGISAFETRQVFAFDSTVRGSLEVRGTPRSFGQVNLCGMRVTRHLTIAESGSDILVGDPRAVDCEGNSVGRDMQVFRNRVRVELVVRGNRIGDDLNVSSNTGSAEKIVEGNRGGDRVSCSSNAEPFRAAANAGWRTKLGQCS
jgi:hypothetical protein